MRYRDYGQLDDPPLLDGDEAFKGLVTREEPDTLEPGMLSHAENIRLADGTAKSRRGIKTLMTQAQVNLIEAEDCFDCVPYNLDNSDYDSALFAGKTKGFILTGTSLTEVNYPPGTSITTGFLFNTSLNTILFGDSDPNLNFELGSKLGVQPMRVFENEDGTIEFKHFKQENVIETQGEDANNQIIFKTENPSLFVKDELISFQGSALTGTFKVTEVTGQLVKAVASDNESRMTWPVLTASLGIVYSLDDQCPSAKFATWAGNRLIIPAGNDDIFISSPLSTHDFPEYNRLTIGSGDTGNITALEPMIDDSLVVFKKHSVHLVTGIYSMRTQDEGGNFSISRISDQLGCSNQNSVQVVGQEIMFYNEQGLYGLTLNAKGAGSVGLPPQAVRINDIAISRDIENLVDNLESKEASIEFYKGRIYLLFPKSAQRRSSAETFCFVYSALLGRWESQDKYRGDGYKLLTLNLDGPKLIMFSKDQGLLEMEAQSTSDSYMDGNFDIETLLITRGYRCKTFSQKHFRRSMFTLFRGPGSIGNVVETRMIYDGDISQDSNNRPSFDNAGQPVHEQGTHHYRDKLRSRAEAVQFRLKTEGISYNLKRVAVEATEASRSTKDQ